MDYLVRQDRDIAHYRREEGLPLPAGIDYLAMHQISTEERQKLHECRPATLGAAKHLDGVRASTLMYLLKWVRKQEQGGRGAELAAEGLEDDASMQKLVEARQ